MATTTRKSTPKTNRKKPAANAKTTRQSKKTVIKNVQAKSAASKTAKASAVTKTAVTPLDRIRSIHLTTAIFYALFAGFVVGFVNMASSAVTLPIAVRDEFASQKNVVLGPAQEVLFNLNAKYVLAASLLVAAVASLLFATKWRARYEATLANRVSSYRWVASGLSLALLFEYVNLLVNNTNLWVIKLSAGAIFLAAIFKWYVERDNSGNAQPSWLAYWMAILAGALAWLPILGSLVGTTIYGEERFGWHVYAISGVLLAGCLVFAATVYRNLQTPGKQRDYALTEQAYLRIDWLTKFAVVLITLSALK